MSNQDYYGDWITLLVPITWWRDAYDFTREEDEDAVIIEATRLAIPCPRVCGSQNGVNEFSRALENA